MLELFENHTVKCNSIPTVNLTFLKNQRSGGVTENIIMNVVIWVILLITFLSLKRVAWGDRNKNKKCAMTEVGWISLLHGEGLSEAPEGEDLPEKGFLRTLLKNMFEISDLMIFEKCGPDAKQYLNFICMLIYYFLISSGVCIVALIPANLQGNVKLGSSVFVRMTIHNLNPESYLLWLHTLASMILLVVCFVTVRRFLLDVERFHISSFTNKTIIIRNIEKKDRDPEILKQYLRKKYPLCDIQGISLIYDVQMLSKLHVQLKNAEEAEKICKFVYDNQNREIMVKEKRCKWKQSNLEIGRFYYSNKCRVLKASISEEFEKVEHQTLPKAFVTLRSAEMAKEILVTEYCRQKEAEEARGRNWSVSSEENMKNNIPSTSKRNAETHNPKAREGKLAEASTSSNSNKDIGHEEDIGLNWIYKKAPNRENIIWANFTNARKKVILNEVIINVAVFCVAFFLTTPTVIVTIVGLTGVDWFLSQYLTTLLAWVLSFSLPALIANSTSYQYFTTKSAMYRSMMKKTVLYLVFVVIILPSLGLTSVSAFVIWNLQESERTKWECLFIPENGIFFVNYVTTSAFLGTMMQLIRIPEILWGIICILATKSEAERFLIRKELKWEFCYGAQYAWLLLIFTMVTFYSMSCPFIAPIGLLYMCFKYYVDRYNIFYNCAPSKLSCKVHAMAAKFILIVLIVDSTGFFFFTGIRSGFKGETLVAFASVVFITVMCSLSLFPSCGYIYQPNDHGRLIVPRHIQVEEKMILDKTDQDYLPDYLKDFMKSVSARKEMSAKRETSEEDSD